VCLPPDDVLFASPDGIGTACSPAAPCALGQVLADVDSAMTYIELVPGTYTTPSSGVIFGDSANVWIVGSGAILDASGVTGSPTVFANGSTVRMDFLTITNSPQDGVECDNGAVTMFRVVVEGGAGVGVASTDCTLVINRSTIATNQGGGVTVVHGTFDIENSFIVLNGSSSAAFSGVTLDPDAGTNLFQFNTVAYNTVASPANSGGVACATSMNLEESLITANAGGNTQTSAMCGTDSTDIISANDDFAFVRPSGSNFDFHLGSGSPAIAVPGNSGPSCGGVDFDGDTRPQQPPNCCIGADEFVPGQPPP
jgi:hypothetical protein